MPREVLVFLTNKLGDVIILFLSVNSAKIKYFVSIFASLFEFIKQAEIIT